MWMGAGLLVKLFHQPEIGSFFKAVALAIKERNAIGISVASKDTCSETGKSMSYGHRQR